MHMRDCVQALRGCRVGEHDASGHISDRVDAWDAGPPVHVRHDPASLHVRETDTIFSAGSFSRMTLFRKQAFCVRPSPGADEDPVCLGDAFFLLFGIDAFQRAASIFLPAYLLHEGAGMDINIPLLQQHLQALGQFFIHVRDDAGQRLQDRDLHAKSTENRCELNADHSAADDQKPVKKLPLLKQFIAGHNIFKVGAFNGRNRGPGPGCDQDKTSAQDLLLSIFRSGYLDCMRIADLPRSVQDIDLFLFHLRGDPAAELLRHGILSVLNSSPVKGYFSRIETEPPALLHLPVKIRAVQQ